MMLHCPGPNGRGCSRNTYIVVDWPAFERGGPAFLEELKRMGWNAGAVRQNSKDYADPLCPHCTQRLLALNSMRR